MKLARGHVVDLLVREGESLVLTEDRCIRLSLIATAVMRHLAQPLSQEMLTERLEAEFGPAPEGAVSQVLEELEAHRLVEPSSK